ncbi:MAG: tripartite tricarboxylate transporter substrate binding protein [Hyphomicrobiales bacterium]|nr:tripartite tricarboxylate transporter substrate binding protein [Hyphomicrobiales bacterium]
MKLLSIALVGIGVAALAVTAARTQDLSKSDLPKAETPKSITIIVPYPAGGLGDIMPRAAAEVLRVQTGRTYIIDNKPGATQTLGARAAAQAKPDGGTLLFGSVTSLVINPAMKKSLPYDPIKDFEPISLVFISPMYVVTRKSLPVKSMKDLIALAKREPGKLTYASGGVGSSSHLAGELLKTLAGIDMVHIPYAGTGPAIRDVIGGHVDVTFTSSGPSYADQVTVLAITSEKRSDIAPDLPTVAEIVPNYEATTWFGFLAPARTPQPIVARYAAELKQTVASGALREKMRASGNELEFWASTPDEFRSYILREMPRWRSVVEAAKIPME